MIEGKAEKPLAMSGRQTSLLSNMHISVEVNLCLALNLNF